MAKWRNTIGGWKKIQDFLVKKTNNKNMHSIKAKSNGKNPKR